MACPVRPMPLPSFAPSFILTPIPMGVAEAPTSGEPIGEVLLTADCCNRHPQCTRQCFSAQVRYIYRTMCGCAGKKCAEGRTARGVAMRPALHRPHRPTQLYAWAMAGVGWHLEVGHREDLLLHAGHFWPLRDRVCSRAHRSWPRCPRLRAPPGETAGRSVEPRPHSQPCLKELAFLLADSCASSPPQLSLIFPLKLS